MALQKAKLALAIATVSSSLAMTGCLVDGDKSNTSSTTVQQDASRISVTDQETPRAEILGIVQDTNGNPVAGARVSIGSAATTTDANGAYSIANVAVTGFTGTGGGAAGDAIQVSVVPNANGATKYLNATVSVTPQASTIIQTVDGDHTNTEDALLAIVTTDGLAVSAGITVVPALQSTVTGVLRDKDTGLTVASAIIGLEVLSVDGVDQQQTQNNGSGTSYGVEAYQAATDAEGRFTFENLPVDTDFDISIEGWTVDSLTGGEDGAPVDGLIATKPENTNQNIGTLYADLITSQDDINPFVTSVTGVVVNGTTGLLNDDLDGTQGLTIHFSEPLQAEVDQNSVYVKNEDTNTQIALASAPVLSADGLSLTLTTADAIPAGTEFLIYLSKADFQDVAGNELKAASAPVVFKGKTTPEYDADAGLTSLGTVELTLQTFSDPVTTAGAVVGLTQLLDDGGDTAFDVLQGLNKTFLDVDTGSLRNDDTGIEQLNKPESAARLKALSDSTHNEANVANPPAVVSADVARVQFTIDNTTESDLYELVLTNQSGQVKPLTVEVSDLAKENLYANGTNKVTLELKKDFQGTVDMLVESVEPGWTLTISSLTSFGSVDGVASVVLTDQIAPTTVLQNSYGAGDDTSAVVGLNYGDGGELSELTTSSVGTPVLNITPRLLTPQVDNGNSLPVPLPVASTWDDLIAGNDSDASGNPQVDITTNLVGAVAYDENAFAAWNAGSRKIGIAMSEDFVLNGNPAYDGTAVLTGWTAQNNVLTNDQNNNGVVGTDLVNVTVPDVIALANNDHGSTIDFSGVLADTFGNAASADNNPKVVVRDLMPPMIKSAVYRGDELELTFNESVVIEDGAEIALIGLGATKVLTIDSGNTTLTADGGTSNAKMTIQRSAWGDELDSESIFNRGEYDHDGDSGNAGATPDRPHGVVAAVEIKDAHGVSWDNWGVVPSLDIPLAIVRDESGDFEADESVDGNNPFEASAGAATFKVEYEFSHPIDLAASGIAAETDEMTAAELQAAGFRLNGDASWANIDISAGSPTGAELDGTTLVVTIRTMGAIAANDTFGKSGVSTIRSEWDHNDTISILSNVNAAP